jgi:hypothetical protein
VKLHEAVSSGSLKVRKSLIQILTLGLEKRILRYND